MQRYLGLLFLVAWTMSSTVHAAACCTSAAAFGVGRLRLWEEWAMGATFSQKSIIGSFNSEHTFEANTAGFGSQLDQWALWGLIPIAPWLQGWMEIPLGIQTTTTPTSQEQEVGLLAPSLGIRHQLIPLGAYLYIPGLSWALTLSPPLSTLPSKKHPASLLDLWLFGVAIGLEETWYPWYLQVNVATQIPTKKASQEEAMWFGPSLYGNTALGVELFSTFVFSLIPSVNWHSFTGGYQTALSFACAWQANPHWILQFALSRDITLPGAGFQTLSSLSGQLGIRYGYF